jgi:hypothetical protein
MPARRLGAAPSLLPVYGRAPTIGSGWALGFGVFADAISLVLRVDVADE